MYIYIYIYIYIYHFVIAISYRLHYEQNPVEYEWAQKIYNGEIISCLPALHEYSHNLGCQLQFGTSHNYLMGKTDGEGTERLWSYARKFSSSLLKVRYSCMFPKHNIEIDTHFLCYSML